LSNKDLQASQSLTRNSGNSRYSILIDNKKGTPEEWGPRASGRVVIGWHSGGGDRLKCFRTRAPTLHSAHGGGQSGPVIQNQRGRNSIGTLTAGRTPVAKACCFGEHIASPPEHADPRSEARQPLRATDAPRAARPSAPMRTRGFASRRYRRFAHSRVTNVPARYVRYGLQTVKQNPSRPRRRTAPQPCAVSRPTGRARRSPRLPARRSFAFAMDIGGKTRA